MVYEYENIEYERRLPFRVFFVSIANRNIHRHIELELIWCIKGSVDVIIRNKFINTNIKLSKNDFFIVNSNEFHGLIHDDTEENILLTVQMKNEYLKVYLPEIDKMFFNHTKFDCPNLNSIMRDMADLIKNYNDFMENKSDFMVFRLLADYNSLLGGLLQFFPHEIIEKASNAYNDRLNRILENLNENYMNKITLSEIALEEHIDIFYLSRFIKSALGMNFQDYLNRTRLEKAIALLIDTEDTIIDIASRCGFSDTKYLNKMLQAEYQCTATQFRDTYRVKHLKKAEITYKGQEHLPINYNKCLNNLKQIALCL